MCRYKSTLLTLTICAAFILCVLLLQHLSNNPIHAPDPLINGTVNNMLTWPVLWCSTFNCTDSITVKLSAHVILHTLCATAATPKYLSLFVPLLCVGIDSNPGPRQSIYPCRYCAFSVNWSHRAPVCNECNIWFHKSYHDIFKAIFDNLNWMARPKFGSVISVIL